MLVDHRLNKFAFVLAYVDQHAFVRNEAVYGVQQCLRVSLRRALLYMVQYLLLQLALNRLQKRQICIQSDDLSPRQSAGAVRWRNMHACRKQEQG